MEVDPPKDEGGDKKESANSEAAPAPNPEEPPKADQDAETKDAEGSKAEVFERGTRTLQETRTDPIRALASVFPQFFFEYQ